MTFWYRYEPFGKICQQENKSVFCLTHLVSLDNESNENGNGGLGGSGQITGTTNLRLLNTSIDTEKLEAVVFVVVGVAIAFLLTGSLFFAACQCIYRQKSMVVGQAHTRFGHSIKLSGFFLTSDGKKTHTRAQNSRKKLLCRNDLYWRGWSTVNSRYSVRISESSVFLR